MNAVTDQGDDRALTGHRVGSQGRTGGTGRVGEPQAPFGGTKSSGYGSFGGRWGIKAFSHTRWVTVATRHADYPF
ncbi:aldehyde dehydrogenase family protein [Streptomyces sp. NPDC004296]|uniref:aldehyde dehydrogenase family protein n=1 Tax=Streptomyces sp. NPDC004296 TaxID=3364697 RepID=UPI0036B846D2